MREHRSEFAYHHPHYDSEIAEPHRRLRLDEHRFWGSLHGRHLDRQEDIWITWGRTSLTATPVCSELYSTTRLPCGGSSKVVFCCLELFLCPLGKKCPR